jgi:hypothetical protein
MNEDEKKLFKDIITMTSDELNESTDNLRNEIKVKISTLLNENNDDEVKSKLESVLNEVESLEPNKLNYYRLITLKDGLD